VSEGNVDSVKEGAGKAGEAGETAAPLTGALSKIRQRRAEIIKEGGNLELLVPDYDDNLKISYRDLSDAEHDKFAKRLERARNNDDTKAERDSGADILIQHCDRIYVREDEDSPWLLLEDQKAGPLRFGKRTAELLGLAANTARETVLDVFSPPAEDGTIRRNPDAIVPHINAIFAWRQGRQEDIDRALLGESAG
jgi:hypothetical protein